jgi:Ca2+-binding RTX toxin-like protein
MPVQATFAADVSQSMGDLFDLLDALFTVGEIVEGDPVFYAAEVPTVSGIVDVDVFGNGLRYSGSGRNTFVSRGTIEDIDVYDRFGLALVVEDFGLSVPTLNTVIDDDRTDPAALETFLMGFGWDALLSDRSDVANRQTRVGDDNVRFNLTGNDTLDGAGGNDDLYSGDGNDRMYGGTGADTLDGGLGRDLLYGEAGSDALFGDAGWDTLDGGTGNDRLVGQSGDDRLIGNVGNDRGLGGDGNDRLDGNDGADTLAGEAGNDGVFGGAGNDRISGGAGTDTVGGGSGDDRFEVNGSSAFDRIIDFTVGDDLVAVIGTGERFADIAFVNRAYGTVATGDGWQIRFDNLSSSDLDAGDFVFV